MKRLIIITTAVFIGIFAFVSTPAFAFYTIDGNVSDWGIDLSLANNGGSGSKPIGPYVNGDLDNMLPTGGNDIDYFTEDNTDASRRNYKVDPGYSTRNTYDAEAIYFDNDHEFAYLAIISGLSSTNTKYPAGDIFIDTGLYQDPLSALYNKNDLGRYGFGLNISDSKLYAVTDWHDSLYSQHSASDPWRIKTGTEIGAVDFVYSGNQNSHYVMEAKIPLAMLDIGHGESDVWLSWTMKCGNDNLKLKADATVAPEPMSLLLMGSGLVGAFGIRRKKRA